YLHLSAPDSCANVRKAVVVANVTVLVMRRSVPCLSGQKHRFFLDRGFGRYECATTRSGYDFVPVKRQNSNVSKSSARLPFVRTSERFGTVLENGHRKLIGNGPDFIYLIRHSVQMNSYDRGGLTSFCFERFKCGSERLRTNVPGSGFRVYKNGFCAQVRNGVGRCRKRKTLTNDVIARRDAQQNKP